MSIISDNIKPEVEKYLADLGDPVTVHFYPHAGSPATEPMAQLLGELHDITSKVDVITHDEPIPPIAPETAEDIEGPITQFSMGDAMTGIRYLGFPGGQEFGTFLEDLVDVSTHHAVTLSEQTQEWLKNLNQPLHLEVFVTPT